MPFVPVRTIFPSDSAAVTVTSEVDWSTEITGASNQPETSAAGTSGSSVLIFEPIVPDFCPSRSEERRVGKECH